MIETLADQVINIQPASYNIPLTSSLAHAPNRETLPLSQSRPQSRVPFGQRHGTKALAGTNLKSANRGLPVVLRRLGADPKIMADQMLCFGPFGLEILGLTNRRLKGKQYEVLKCVVLDNNDVLAVLETVKSLIYQLLPPVFALISYGIWRKPTEKKSTVSTVVVILPLNALVRDQMVKTCVLMGSWGHGRRCRRLDLCQ